MRYAPAARGRSHACTSTGRRSRMVKVGLICLCALLLAQPSAAQYPERPVVLLSGYPAGGMVDIVARLLAEGMKSKFPRGIVVTIRSGAGGALAAAEVATGKPDGY